jgi:ubiquinone/menaquinone biosynthesis C-methylase UbiE
VTGAMLWALLGCGAAPEEEELSLTPGGDGSALYERLGRTYQDRDAEALTNQLEQRHEDADAVMAWLALKEGMVVADIGCGVGYFTRRLSAAVGPTGTVHALDIQPEAIDFLRQELGDDHENVRLSVNTLDDVKLPEASIDFGFMAHLDFYLQPELMTENTRFLQSVFRAVRPGGQLVVLQYIAPGQTVDPLSGHFQALGFVASAVEHDPEHSSYLYRFTRPAR